MKNIKNRSKSLMMKYIGNKLVGSALILFSSFLSYGQKKSIVIQDQGSFAVGGSVVTAPGTFDPIKHGAFNPANQSSEGQTLHGDHAYVFYQIPDKARKLPL